MEIISAYLGLTMAFMIIGFILLYFVINSESHVILKTGAITMVIWYGLVMFYIPPRLMGWPTHQSLPDKSKIMYAIIKEPKDGDKGSIYLLVIGIDDDKKLLIQQINPKHIFDYKLKNTPRIYRMPYDREFHKKLERARRKAGKKGTMILEKEKPQEKQGGRSFKKIKDKFKFKILNPMELLRKD